MITNARASEDNLPGFNSGVDALMEETTIELQVNCPPLKRSLEIFEITQFSFLKMPVYEFRTVYEFWGVYFKHVVNRRHVSTIVELPRIPFYK